MKILNLEHAFYKDFGRILNDLHVPREAGKALLTLEGLIIGSHMPYYLNSL